MNHNYVSIPQ